MRVLFAFTGGSGHADPLVPLARAAEALGYDVAFSGRASVVAALPGFTTFPDPAGPADAPQAITPLLELDPAREDRILRDGVAGTAARRRASRVLALCAGWSPDAIVCDEFDFGAMVAAERAGVPRATVLACAAGSFVRPEVVADPLHALRSDHGLPPDPGLAMLRGDLVLSPCPPSFRDPAFPLPRGALSIQPAVMPIRPRGSGRPTIYFTLGTIFNAECGDLFARVLAGLRELPVDVIATYGPRVDAAEFGPQPANVRLAPHIPQAEVLPDCDAVVNHGGSGSVIGALTAGLPQVMLPIGADQPLNADRCEVLGAGLRLDALRATPEQVREAVRAVLENPGYRDAADRIREEIAGLPGPAIAVATLERL